MQSDDVYSQTDGFWNASVTVGLNFEANLVKENSTSINGTSKGIPEFAASYVRASAQSTTATAISSADDRPIATEQMILICMVALFLFCYTVV